MKTKRRDSGESIKCVVWDLDNTLWSGVLLESETVALKPQVASIIETLDRRGILHSIASRNDHHMAMQQLSELGIDRYFLYPQINWNSKAASISACVLPILKVPLGTKTIIAPSLGRVQESPRKGGAVSTGRASSTT